MGFIRFFCWSIRFLTHAEQSFCFSSYFVNRRAYILYSNIFNIAHAGRKRNNILFFIIYSSTYTERYCYSDTVILILNTGLVFKMTLS